MASNRKLLSTRVSQHCSLYWQQFLADRHFFVSKNKLCEHGLKSLIKYIGALMSVYVLFLHGAGVKGLVMSAFINEYNSKRLTAGTAMSKL